MIYDDFAVTVTDTDGQSYPVSAVASDLGRVSSRLAPIAAELRADLAGLAQDPGAADPRRLRAAGEALFRWLLAGPLETHFRLSWDRAVRAGRGLRLRLSLDPPKLAGLPWELLHDPARDQGLATSASLPLVRFLDRADNFGSLAQAEAELPLALLHVLPEAPGLDLCSEQETVREAVRPLRNALGLHVLDGPVTRTRLADTLAATPFDIVHVTTHGGLLDGASYLQLNNAEGGPDWVDVTSWVRLFTAARKPRLVVLSVCQSGQVDEAQAFHGCAPLLLRAGIPAVIAMQYAISDQAALAFAREFYRHLCAGAEAGQVEAAVSHTRNMLAALFPGSLAFAAPVIYTRLADGRLFRPPEPPEEVLTGSESARLAMFMSSLEASMDFVDDWALADAAQLAVWHRTLLWAEQAYARHLSDSQPAAQEAARHGLVAVQNRLATLEEALANAEYG